jgi:hypothetical protein
MFVLAPAFRTPTEAVTVPVNVLALLLNVIVPVPDLTKLMLPLITPEKVLVPLEAPTVRVAADPELMMRPAPERPLSVSFDELMSNTPGDAIVKLDVVAILSALLSFNEPELTVQLPEQLIFPISKTVPAAVTPSPDIVKAPAPDTSPDSVTSLVAGMVMFRTALTIIEMPIT